MPVPGKPLRRAQVPAQAIPAGSVDTSRHFANSPVKPEAPVQGASANPDRHTTHALAIGAIKINPADTAGGVFGPPALCSALAASTTVNSDNLTPVLAAGSARLPGKMTGGRRCRPRRERRRWNTGSRTAWSTSDTFGTGVACRRLSRGAATAQAIYACGSG